MDENEAIEWLMMLTEALQAEETPDERIKIKDEIVHIRRILKQHNEHRRLVI